MFNAKMPNLGPLNRPIRYIRRHLPPVNFITLHYTYFIVTSLLSGLVFWGSATPFKSISFTNSLFLTISAMTGAGLNTVNLSEINTFQQIILFLLMLFGSPIFISAIIVHIRWKAFALKMSSVKKEKQGRLHRAKTWASSAVKGRSRTTVGDEEAAADDEPIDDADAEAEKKDTAQHESPAKKGGLQFLDTSVDSSTTTGESSTNDNNAASPVMLGQRRTPGITFADDTRFASPKATATGRVMTGLQQGPRKKHGGLFSFTGVGAKPWVNLRTDMPLTNNAPLSPATLQRANTNTDFIATARRDITKYLDNAEGWISRNSQFYGLTEEEREQLGGVEYRAVSLLEWLVPAYFILFQLIAAIGVGGYIALNKPGVAEEFGVNPWWAGAFNVVSAFNNCGMSLIDANMVPFQRSYYMLITIGILVLAGNTCYAIFLRIIVWAMYHITKRIADNRPLGDEWRERNKAIRFLLDHPRRCYIMLFPAQHTWWLGLTVFALNGIDWTMFELLNIGNRAIFDGLATRYIVIDSLFQTLAVRGGGFYVFTTSALRISLLVLYVVMMYVSVYPVAITMRNSNVYEERSLGIYAEEDGGPPAEEQQDAESKKDDDGDSKLPVPGRLTRAKTAVSNNFSSAGGGAQKKENNEQFVRQQIRAQLAHDIWWVVLGIFLIMIVEADHFDAKPAVYSVFNYIFEIVSGYSCVGMSIGVPWASYAFSGSWHTLSKVIMCGIMLRGRHRGLPVAIDKAVLLPGEQQNLAEEEDGRLRLAKSRTRAMEMDF